MNHRSRIILVTFMIFFIEWLLPINDCLAVDFKIIDIHRNIPLADTEEVFKDYYIAGGLNESFKENQVVNVFRTKIFKPSEASKETYNIKILVGKLKILSVQNGISIARLYESTNLDNLPFTEQPGILVGDLVDLKGAFIDNKKKLKVRDTARIDGEEEEKLDIDGIPLKDKKIQKNKGLAENLNLPAEATPTTAMTTTVAVPPTAVETSRSIPTTVTVPVAIQQVPVSAQIPASDISPVPESAKLSTRKEASEGAPQLTEVKNEVQTLENNENSEQNSDKILTSEKTPGPEARTAQ